MNGRRWTFYDKRTGHRVSSRCFESFLEADDYLHSLVMDPQPHNRNLLPYVKVIELTEDTWGSRPGEIIGPIESPELVRRA